VLTTRRLEAGTILSIKLNPAEKDDFAGLNGLIIEASFGRYSITRSAGSIGTPWSLIASTLGK
jgi:hypothetical protein